MVLTPIPEFHREIGFPRSVALEYPFGRALGQVHDAGGQRRVLLATLNSLQTVTKPGIVEHLPYTWPEEPKTVKWHPPEISPIVNQLLAEIKKHVQKTRPDES